MYEGLVIRGRNRRKHEGVPYKAITMGITPRIHIVLVFLLTQVMNEQTNTIK